MTGQRTELYIDRPDIPRCVRRSGMMQDGRNGLTVDTWYQIQNTDDMYDVFRVPRMSHTLYQYCRLVKLVLVASGRTYVFFLLLYRNDGSELSCAPRTFYFCGRDEVTRGPQQLNM